MTSLTGCCVEVRIERHGRDGHASSPAAVPSGRAPGYRLHPLQRRGGATNRLPEQLCRGRRADANAVRQLFDRCVGGGMWIRVCPGRAGDVDLAPFSGDKGTTALLPLERSASASVFVSSASSDMRPDPNTPSTTTQPVWANRAACTSNMQQLHSCSLGAAVLAAGVPGQPTAAPSGWARYVACTHCWAQLQGGRRPHVGDGPGRTRHTHPHARSRRQ